MSNGKKIVPELSTDKPMIGNSMAMREVKAYLLKIAGSDCTILITGETGTGKELAVELIHRNSSRQEKPLVYINCAALPDSLVESELFGYDQGAFTGAAAATPGKFELATGGAVFLDEISDMSPSCQAKLLMAIEKKEIYRLGGKRAIPLDVRIIAATNQDPELLMKKGRFRADLYYRLSVARVHMPPLRERKEDIPCLLEHYIRRFNRRFEREVEGFTVESLDYLLNYDWPGNVRELKNLIEASFVSLPSRKTPLMDLPKSMETRLKKSEGLSENERDRVLSALVATNWNKSKAAQMLHLSRMTIYRKMAKYQIITKA